MHREGEHYVTKGNPCSPAAPAPLTEVIKAKLERAADILYEAHEIGLSLRNRLFGGGPGSAAGAEASPKMCSTEEEILVRLEALHVVALNVRESMSVLQGRL